MLYCVSCLKIDCIYVKITTLKKDMFAGIKIFLMTLLI